MRAFLKYFEMEPVEIVAGGVGSPTYRHVRWEEHGTRDRDKALAFLIKTPRSILKIETRITTWG